MNPPEVALGFTNTLDYEMEWDAAYVQALIDKSRVEAGDVREYAAIGTMRQLLGSFLYHFRRGTGLGAYVEEEALLHEVLSGAKSRLTLGGTAVRAAQALSALGHDTLLHLVSQNPETLERLPRDAEWVCSRDTVSRSPHLTIQFPMGARLSVGGERLTAPSSNRVIYTRDEDNARLAIAPAFFERADGCRLMVLSSFDIVQDRAVLLNRLSAVRRGLSGMRRRCAVFYEDAHFTHPEFPPLIRDALLPLIDVYSMNEDEFSRYVGGPVDLLSAGEVAEALGRLSAEIPVPCLVVHSRHWALGYGPLAREVRGALEQGVAVAGTRYRLGDGWTPGDVARTRSMPIQKKAAQFARGLEALLPGMAACLPAYDLHPLSATTIGLGDSFVGGFASDPGQRKSNRS